MLNGNKPWQKALFENFLMIFSLLAIVIVRIASKFINPDFSIYNLLSLAFAIAGFLLIFYSKREQLKRREFFKFGVNSQNPKNYKYYRLGYIFLVMGLILTFVI